MKTLKQRIRSVETLEKREMLASDLEGILREQVLFSNEEVANQSIAAIVSKYGDHGTSNGGEGGSNDLVNIAEVEPNNSINIAQVVPLADNFGVNIAGSNTVGAFDADWFAFDLQAGDILDSRFVPTTSATVPIMSMHNLSGKELIASPGLVGPPASPQGSPLRGNAADLLGPDDLVLHYIVPESGRYYIRVSDAGGPYSLELRKYRAALETQDAGNQQILFLDFDGAFIPRSLFIPIPGTGRIPSTRNALAGYGIQDADYERFIDEVVTRLQAKYDDLGTKTTNPNYGIEIRNSKDHPDPWGLPNVSRVVIGGNALEFFQDDSFEGVLGIAESVDAGNFAPEETALVFHDVLQASFASIPIDPFARPVDVVAELMSMVIAHESGHFFGGRHQDPTNNAFAPVGLMDQFYDPIVSSGAGPDGIFGNVDDVPLLFNVDEFTAEGAFVQGGVNDTVNWIGWALSNGQANGGVISGQVFDDVNANGLLDSVDRGLGNVTVYADLNNNGGLDAGEISTVSASDGSYQLVVAPGTYTIREIVPASYRLTTAESVTVTATANQTSGGVNFGNATANSQVTGRKWNDVNGNGVRDIYEPPIEGVWIYIDQDGDNRIDLGEPATQTAADGTYTLHFPGAGTYTIREVLQTGFVQTYPGPAADDEHTIVLTGDPALDATRTTGLDFGNLLTVDYGDAPVSYGEASHGFVSGLILGAEWDSEQGSAFSDNALGDDATGPLDGTGAVIDDEDGVLLTSPLVAGSTSNSVAITAVNSTGETAFVTGWFDFNHNGVFEDFERAISNVPVTTGTTNVTFTAPGNAQLGDTIARFRLSNETGVAPTGLLAAGEVEDHVFSVTDSSDLAVDDQFEVARNSTLNVLDVLTNDFELPGEQLEILDPGVSAAGGVLQISADGQTILYTPPSGFVGQDSFTYTVANSRGQTSQGNVIITVKLQLDEPVAVDDSFNVTRNAINVPLNVLANDIEGVAGALTIVSVTQPDKGGQLTIASGGKSLSYTPQNGSGDMESAVYTVADPAGNTASATINLTVKPDADANDQVLIELRTVDLSGNPISAIQQGEEFQIQMYVDDLRFSAASPGVAAGVFAVYTDLLYSLQLVGTVPNTDPNAAFNFQTSFFNDYVNGQTGDATIPGIINEFGAFSSRPTMSESDPLLFATVNFTAQSPGIADFIPNPADNFPNSDTLLFDTPGSAVPIERIRYVGASLEIVGDGVEFPVAVDDSPIGNVPLNSASFPINVLDNDLPGSTGTISIDSVTNGSFGTTRVDGDRILYTPTAGFEGTDQFVYTIVDAAQRRASATVTVDVGDAAADDIVALRIAVTDVNGQPIDQVELGSQFQVRGFVEDLRGFGLDRGVFAAYEDVLYNRGLVSPVASQTNDPDLGFEVQFGPNYQRVREGDIRTDGVINEIGAVQIENGNQPLGLGEQLLFVITMTANNIGTAEFIADPADITPLHDTLTFEPPTAVPFDRIGYGFDTVAIVAPGGGGGEGEHWQNPFNRFDVNLDGFVTALDVLLGIRWLNDLAAGEDMGRPQFAYDVSGDTEATPIDPLMVINELNRQAGNRASGEGEAAFIDLSALSAPITGDTVDRDVVEVLIEKDEDGRISARNTSTVYGPSPLTDVLADDSEDDDLDLLLDELAPSVNENWNS